MLFRYALMTISALNQIQTKCSSLPLWLLWSVPMVMVGVQRLTAAYLLQVCPQTLLVVNDFEHLLVLSLAAKVALVFCQPLYAWSTIPSVFLLIMVIFTMTIIQYTACTVFLLWHSTIGLYVAMTDCILLGYVFLNSLVNLHSNALMRISVWEHHSRLVPLWVVPQIVYLLLIAPRTF